MQRAGRNPGFMQKARTLDGVVHRRNAARCIVVSRCGEQMRGLEESLRAVFPGIPLEPFGDVREAVNSIGWDARGLLFFHDLRVEELPREVLWELRRRSPSMARVLVCWSPALEECFGAINDGVIDRVLAYPISGERLLELWRSEGLGESGDGDSGDRGQGDEARLAFGAGAKGIGLEHTLGFAFRILQAFHPMLALRTQAVVELCRAMAMDASFESGDREALMTSSWILDLGLVSVERELLYRSVQDPASCSEDEIALLRHHPLISETMAVFVDEWRSVAAVVRSHHENYDGSGYPAGLAGDRIPWLARCLRVAVGYVESGKSGLEAVDYLQDESGRLFDPEAVRLFVRNNPASRLPRNVREVLMAELEPGMELVRGIMTRAGVLLVPGGQVLNEGIIAKLRSHARLQLVTERLVVRGAHVASAV